MTFRGDPLAEADRTTRSAGPAAHAREEPVHAILIRNLKARPPVTDLFGAQGRKWLSEQGLPDDEREMVEACLRGIDFLDREVAAIDPIVRSPSSYLPRPRCAGC